MKYRLEQAVSTSIRLTANIERRRLQNSRRQLIILQLIREGKPEGECSMLLPGRAEIPQAAILAEKGFENENRCMRNNAKLRER
jgi:hypothetical protein